MSGYLEDYGTADARRAKILKRIVLSLLLLAVLAGVLYFTLRDRKEKRQAAQFLELLRQKDFQAAYRHWGCTEAKPCPYYSYEKFLEDWGPKSGHADLSRLRVTKTRSCGSGIIQTLDFGGGEEVLLWVERKDLSLGFAPWPSCHPRMAAPLPES